MPEDLAEFLGKSKKINKINEESAMGAFACQECLVIVESAIINQDEHVMSWTCQDGHKSQVKI
jgi:hypothetical protein